MSKKIRNHVVNEDGTKFIDCSPVSATVAYVAERIDIGTYKPHGIFSIQYVANGEQSDLLVAYTIGDNDTYTLRYTDIEDGVLVAYVNDFGHAIKDAILFTRESVIAHVLGNSADSWQTDLPPLNLTDVPAPIEIK